ncbi:MAG: SpoIIE family protein phosphatase, partial [Actinobacteria bacterium]|nr:SpoIIE family protein phosphatase [Actinomycetota bacterium]
EPWQSDRQTPLTHSFCQYVVRDGRPLVIEDARLDERLRDNLAITDLGVVAYAGFPLRDATGQVVGSLCAIDTQPRGWTPAQLSILEDLAHAASTELQLQAAPSGRELNDNAHRASVLLELSEALADTVTLADVAAALQTVGEQQLGCNHAGIWVLPAGSRTGDLRYADHPRRRWRQAEQRQVLPADDTNPIGAPLVGRRPLVYRDRAEQDAQFPQLAGPPQDGDGQARVFMPLTVSGEPLGTLALLWAEPREFTDQDRITIAALTSYTAHAVHRAQLLQDRTTVAATLQASMLSALPQPDDLELAARYRPATAYDQVGGDWYDAVIMPSGTTNLMIGDVMGHDIHATAAMGQLRSMLRALAWALDDPPSTNVSRLDQAIHDFGLDTMATLILARIEQSAADHAAGLRQLRWTNAGHLPPLLLPADGPARLLAEHERADRILGATVRGPQRQDRSTPIPSGATLLLYTDGLVERRTDGISAGLDRLRAAAEANRERPLDQFLDAVLQHMLGQTPTDDDTALLAVRFHPQS